MKVGVTILGTEAPGGSTLLVSCQTESQMSPPFLGIQNLLMQSWAQNIRAIAYMRKLFSLSQPFKSSGQTMMLAFQPIGVSYRFH